MLIWLYSNTDIRIQGTIIGFDEYMNLVLDDAEEIKQVSRRVLRCWASRCLSGSIRVSSFSILFLERDEIENAARPNYVERG